MTVGFPPPSATSRKPGAGLPRNWLRVRALAMLLWAISAAYPSTAQLRSLENPSFESTDPAGPGAPNWENVLDPNVPGWRSTTGEIELWDSTFSGVTAYDGNVLAELNANTASAIYQNICLVNGEPLGWSFAHRAREGGPTTQTVRLEVANTGGSLLQLIASHASTLPNPAWSVNSGTVTYTGPSGLQRVQLATSDPGGVGNLIDLIRLSLRPFVQLSAATGSAGESAAMAGQPTLLVTGSTQSAISVTITITGGTADRGTDYTTPGGGASFVVSIPAGTYYNSPIPLGIAIIDDNVAEANETITFQIAAGSAYTVANTTTCGAASQATSTYTIADNDARLALSKTSSVQVDGINAANPKAIPGATVDYCIQTTNPGSVAAEVVSVSDPLPANLTYIAGSLRTGLTCSTASTAEDDDGTGVDEADPAGASFDGSVLRASIVTGPH